MLTCPARCHRQSRPRSGACSGHLAVGRRACLGRRMLRGPRELVPASPAGLHFRAGPGTPARCAMLQRRETPLGMGIQQGEGYG